MINHRRCQAANFKTRQLKIMAGHVNGTKYFFIVYSFKCLIYRESETFGMNWWGYDLENLDN